MIDQKFVLLGALLNIWGSGAYVISTLKGKTKPNRVTWLLWAVAPLIAFWAQLGEGVKWESLMTFMVGFGPLIIFAVSFVNSKSYWKITKLDIACGSVSVLALILWLFTGTGLIAIIFSILADFLAGVPTIVKAFKEPETEHSGIFRNGALSAAITLLTIKDWKFANYAFAIYISYMCSFVRFNSV